MIISQLISLFFGVAVVYASEFDVKSKRMEIKTAVPMESDDSRMKLKLKELVIPTDSMKLIVKVDESESESPNEDDQIFAFMELMNLITFICEKAALQHEDKRVFTLNWIDAIFELAKETYGKQFYEDSIPDFDNRETLKSKGRAEEFDFVETLTLKHQIYQDILFSSEEEESDSLTENSNETDYSDLIEDIDDETDHFVLMKSKMIRGEISDDEKEDWQSDTISEYSDCKDEHELDERKHEEEEKYKGQVRVRDDSLRVLKGKSRRRNRGDMMGSILKPDNLNMAADFMTSTMTMESKLEGDYQVNEQIAISGINSVAMMEQIQQQVMDQIMSKLAESNPQLAQYGLILQDERSKFEAAMGGGDGEDLPKITGKGIVEFLKSSAIPKLLNSTIKGKTGIDVLRTLSMLLRSLNEGLGIFEVILKTLLRVTRAVRYYALCMADIVNEMAREDNLTPIVDLSVPMDSVLMKKKSGGKMKKLSSMIRKKCKTAENGANDSDTEVEMSPFTMGIHAALSKTHDFTTELQKLPSVLLLRLIHTIFAELEKRNGIIRVALARKQHKTLIGMQEEINFAVEHIFEAIMVKDEGAYSQLQSVNPMMITEILISLISPIKMNPESIEKHISEVTTWIKPLMVIMNQESQINMLNYLLTDPDIESSFRKSQGLHEDKRVNVKKFNWTPSKKLMERK